MRKTPLLVLLTALLCFMNAAAEDSFGIVPPEFPSGSGSTADQLDAIIARVDQEGLPPSHRMRMLYEWMTGKFAYDETDDFAVTEDMTAGDAAAELYTIFRDNAAGDGGFALLAHYLMERLGYPTVIITGELQLPDGEIRIHQWNYVQYSGKWYHFDPLGEKLNPALNGFMNVEKELKDGPLRWDAEALPESAEYAVSAVGCACTVEID